MTKDREAIHMLKEDTGLRDIWDLLSLTIPTRGNICFFLNATNPILELIHF